MRPAPSPSAIEEAAPTPGSLCGTRITAGGTQEGGVTMRIAAESSVDLLMSGGGATATGAVTSAIGSSPLPRAAE